MFPITLNAELTYATKSNIAFPGTAGQATAAEAVAQTRLTDATAGQGLDALTFTVGAGSIEVAT